MALMAMTVQPFVNAVGFGYMNRGAKVNWSVARGIASLAFAVSSKVYATLAERDIHYLLELYLLSTAGILVCSLILAGKEAEVQGPRPQVRRGGLYKRYPAFFGMLLGTALLIGALVETPMMLLFTRVADRCGVKRLLLVSAVGMALKPWIILLPGTVWGVYLMRFSHFFTFALFLLALTYYANERMAEDEKVTGQALITGAISLSGVFSYLFGGMLISGCGALRSLLICTLIGMAGGALFLLFAVRDQKENK